jgi:hypothetical protein
VNSYVRIWFTALTPTSICPEMNDEATGCSYWERTDTGLTTWNRPASLDVTVESSSDMDELVGIIEYCGLSAEGCVSKDDFFVRAQRAKAGLIQSEICAAMETNEDAGAGEAKEEWQQKFDVETECFYFEHGVTGEVVWSPPSSFEETRAKSAEAEVTAYPDEMSNTMFEKTSVDEHGNSEWEEKYDDESGFSYFQNSVSGEIVWEKPDNTG